MQPSQTIESLFLKTLISLNLFKKEFHQAKLLHNFFSKFKQVSTCLDYDAKKENEPSRKISKTKSKCYKTSLLSVGLQR